MLFLLLSFSEMELFSEEELVISPFLFPQEVKEAPANITIFTKEDIEELGIQTLAELLMLVDGVYVTPSERHLHRVWVRGVKGYYNDRILLLIDGIPQREPIYGHAPVDENLPLDLIERVEVMKGPLSSLYGSNAFAAVVNVITKKPEKETRISASLGSFNTVEGWIRSSGDKFLAEGRIYNTEGDGPEFSKDNERNSLRMDPVHAENFIGKFKYREITLFWGYEKFRHRYTTLWDVPYEDWAVDWFFYNTLRFSLLIKKKRNWIEGGVRLYYENYDNGGYYEISRDTITYGVFPIKKSSLCGMNGYMKMEGERWGIIGGGVLERLHVRDVRDLYVNLENPEDTVSPFSDTSSIYDYWMDPRTIYTWGVFTEGRLRLGILSLMGGLRADKYGEEKINMVPRAILKIGKRRKFSLKVMYGEAYRNPSMRELYIKSTGIWPQGNEELKDEKITTREVLLYLYPWKNTLFKISLFGNTVRNLIRVENRMYVNSAEEDTIIGAEFALKNIGEKHRLSLNLSHLLKEDSFYPRTMLKCVLNYRPTYTLSISPVFMWVSSRGDEPPFWDVSFSVCKIRGPFTINFKIQNLFNRHAYDPNYRDPDERPIDRGERKFLLRVSYAL